MLYIVDFDLVVVLGAEKITRVTHIDRLVKINMSTKCNGKQHNSC